MSLQATCHWTVHGLVMGLVFSFPVELSGPIAPESAEYGKRGMFLWTVVLGMVYRLLIEVITCGLFKARIQRGSNG